MSDAFRRLHERAQKWFDRGRAVGWLTDVDGDQLSAVEQRTPDDLFAEQSARPLVIAFFGGTGVGKSSLLNRLAGESIARTGVERPTSREVTLYLHQTVQLARLPKELPIESERIRRHSAPEWRDVLWIDAPDIDSTEEANRAVALAWLPHVDLICYVVSPERYRDDAGWRVLLQHGQSHGWMFIINRWDEGDPRQRDDFARILRDAGFEHPLLLCTACAPPRSGLAPLADDFPRIRTEIRKLLDSHGLTQLVRIGEVARLNALRAAVEHSGRRFGDEAAWRSVRDSLRRHWQQTADDLREGVEWPIRTAAARLAVRNSGLLLSLRQKVDAAIGIRSPQPTSSDSADRGLDNDVAHLTSGLWDAWANSKLDAFLNEIEVAIGRRDIAAAPIRARLDAVAHAAESRIVPALTDAVRAAFATPGTWEQRLARRATQLLMTALPTLALLWVVYNLIGGYYRASSGLQPFYGVDFAVHSTMLVFAVWILPFLLDQWLKPSLEKAAIIGLRGGFSEGLEVLLAQFNTALEEAASFAKQQRTASEELIAEIHRECETDSSAPTDAAVEQVIARQSVTD